MALWSGVGHKPFSSMNDWHAECDGTWPPESSRHTDQREPLSGLNEEYEVPTLRLFLDPMWIPMLLLLPFVLLCVAICGLVESPTDGVAVVNERPL